MRANLVFQVCVKFFYLDYYVLFALLHLVLRHLLRNYISVQNSG